MERVTVPSCRAHNYNGHWPQACSRPVKSDGLCSLHLAGQRKRAANNAVRTLEFEARATERQRRIDEAAALARLLGIEVLPGGSPGNFLVRGDDLRKLAPKW